MATVKSTTKSSSAGNAQSMAELMNAVKNTSSGLRKGDVITGTITKLTPSEILLDINAKSEALVLEKDKKILRHILSTLKVGDKITASVLNPESDMGYPIVSLRRFMDDTVWERLQQLHKEQKPIAVFVSNLTRGGYLVNITEGAAGFMPNSQTTLMENPQEIVGKTIDAYVLELNRVAKKIIFSQKPLLSPQDFEKAVSEFKLKSTVKATVSHITPFGVFVALISKDGKRLDGLIHISEISWEKVLTVEDMFAVGQPLEAVVIGIDRDGKRIDLSLKRLTQDPFEELMKKFSVDQKVTGTVAKIQSMGVSVELAGSEGAGKHIEGFIKKEKIPPTMTYKVGDSVNATITEIDAKRHRIILTPILKEKPIGYR